QGEIVADAHDAEEQAMGWYYHLEEHLRFPFRAKCIAQRAISPLRKGQEVEVVGLAPAKECDREMFITLTWERRTLAVPLAQVEPECDESPLPKTRKLRIRHERVRRQ